MSRHAINPYQTRHDKCKGVMNRIVGCALLAIAGVGLAVSAVNREDDRNTLASLDTDYQKAVEQNDTKTMARILADDFILVLGDGSVYTKNDLLKDAASGHTRYERQVDSDRTVRVWGNTAVVTAKLWVKGLEDGKQVDYCQWFSDTYIRKPTGWSYIFGQASLALPTCSK
jgi:ketosteroid isomerase-like protein